MSRVIAGTHRGRRLQTPTGDSTRPTTDRVREALFSALASWAGTASAGAEEALAGLSFLDLYAGSGAVGLEAASRGAAPVLLVESDARTAAVARRNVATLGVPATVRATAVQTLARTAADRAYDVVFADPPYAVEPDRLDAVVADLLAQGWVAPDGLVVLERSTRSVAPVWPPGTDEPWSRAYGETVLHFASVAAQPRSPA
ncbi:16S rRNA (guanine(966)-N(2))-methyltransferase RsmD [Microlunatus flavus]|uniref:16S rRNA (Guanine966-N2)-methyltransferase n=1 Tax=Microlunatus flavus TaxID=1036181 RepID=A0A1H9DMB4_9ACTN|nr:16S rRNA (guanine(966)-N(2))-methyltransferase RsmD [Microlunatus flavus]SEQ14642.1 16S rRNA (guanine966-N2)-methyltransferase [Microlunatus flavus]